MKYFQSTITYLSFTVTLGITVAAYAAQPDNLERAAKDLEIMSHIIQTSLQPEDSNRRFMWRQQVDAHYLAGQGVVFSIHLPGSGNFYNYISAAGDHGAVFTAAAPMPPVPPVEIDGQTGFVVSSSGFSSATQSDEQRKAMEEIRDAMREKERAMQSVQREIRDVQRQIARADNDTKELDKKMKELEKNLNAQADALEQQRKTYTDVVTDMEKKNQAQREENNKIITHQIVKSLCDYGSTLKSLKSGERVSLILENYADNRDQIYVFDYKDIASCTSSDKLMNSAIAYQM